MAGGKEGKKWDRNVLTLGKLSGFIYGSLYWFADSIKAQVWL